MKLLYAFDYLHREKKIKKIRYFEYRVFNFITVHIMTECFVSKTLVLLISFFFFITG
jgi:hypothetical protein